jgi:hypothetical protein
VTCYWTPTFERAAREILAEPYVERCPMARFSIAVKGREWDDRIFGITALMQGEFVAR